MINKFSILNGAKHFSLEIFLNYLIFTPAKKYIKYINDNTQINSWKSIEMSKESIENITKSDINFAPTFTDHQISPYINFNRHSCDHEGER